MKYYALMIGKGEGCDYTIGCNKDFRQLEATTIVEARKEIEDYLMERNIDDFELIQILSVSSFIDFDIEEFKDFLSKEKKSHKNPEYEKYLQLKKKYEG